MSGTIYYRRRRKGDSAAFSLFPFLAVLLCTMGVLILLLVLISKNIREKDVLAEEPGPLSEPVRLEEEANPDAYPFDPTFLGLEKETPPEEILQKLTDERESVQWLAGELRDAKEEKKRQLDDVRARIASVEQGINKILEQIEQTTEQMKSLLEGSIAPEDQLAQLRKILEEKKEEKQRVEAELQALVEEQEEKKRSYAIVPYRGPNGTFRRPIYIECRNDCIVLQPEGIVLKSQDFLTPERRDNPMEMCVRTIRHYFVGMGQVQRDTEPYPLFIVRPSGIYAYEAARRSLGSWRDDFGYELIDDDWNLEFPQPSEELKKRLEDQLEIARARQNAFLQQEILAGLQKKSKEYYKAGNQGGLERIGGSGSDPLIIARRELLRETGSPGTANLSGNSGGDPGMSPFRTTDSANATGAGGIAAETGADPGKSGSMGSPGLGSGEEFVSDFTPSNFAIPGPYATDLSGVQNGDEGEFPAPLNSPNPQDLQGFPELRNAPGSFPFGSENAISGNTTSENTGSPGESTTAMGTPSGENANSCPPGAEPFSQSAAASNFAAQMPNMHIDSLNGMPAITFEDITRGPRTEQRKKNWGIKDIKTSAQAVNRIVRLECEADRFILSKQPGLSRNIEIPFNGVTQNSSERLVKAIWDYMETWDSAGENHYWRPILRIKVRPGGEARFQTLKSDLASSGLGIESVP